MSVSTVLRPGGVLVYSTCSTEPEETEEVKEFGYAVDQYGRRVEQGTPGSRWVTTERRTVKKPEIRLVKTRILTPDEAAKARERAAKRYGRAA